jgi:hypothetical protein
MDNEKDYMDDMVASVFDGDKDDFASAFKSEVEERIADKLTDKQLEISSDLIHSSEEEEQ